MKLNLPDVIDKRKLLNESDNVAATIRSLFRKKKK